MNQNSHPKNSTRTNNNLSLTLHKAETAMVTRDWATAIKAYRQVKDKSGLGRFLRPVGITVDSDDHVIITDTAGRLQVYAKDHDYVEPEFKLEIDP